ncbi:MAG: flagellar assembly protein FliX, partial [Hyphomicrobiaceae bacterium]|nr:flagellar assembly protein FliX [Hyphomicrobiaceae bacterium]
RRRAIQRGHDLLDSLEGLRADLLAGRVSGERLQRILSLVRRQSGSGDPKLDEVIADIELRAQVELAKLGRFPS